MAAGAVRSRLVMVRMGASVRKRLAVRAKRSVIAEKRRSLAILKDYPVGIEQPEATDRVELQLSLEDVTSLGFRATANCCPVLPGETRLLYLEYGFF